ncbi:MAG: hypothetical protein U0Q07_20355 [Acidimicrobiales bacterium]
MALVATLVLLAGCRVFTFPVAAPGTMTSMSSAVTITNTTPYQVFVRFQAYCGEVGSWGFVVRDVDQGRRLAQACPSPTGAFPLNGTLVDVPNPDLPVIPVVLSPGQSITVVGEAFGAGVNETSGRSVPFDAYAEWCFDGCADIAKLTP